MRYTPCPIYSLLRLEQLAPLLSMAVICACYSIPGARLCRAVTRLHEKAAAEATASLFLPNIFVDCEEQRGCYPPRATDSELRSHCVNPLPPPCNTCARAVSSVAVCEHLDFRKMQGIYGPDPVQEQTVYLPECRGSLSKTRECGSLLS